MANPDSIPRPIQVFLNTGQFIERRVGRRRGGNRDFFKGNNDAFGNHKAYMCQRLKDAAKVFRDEGWAAGFVVVQMREEALAKSYRPLNALFSNSNSFRLVAGGRIGENFFQCTPNALEHLNWRIETRAEIEPRIVENTKTGMPEERVSGYRSELGGIEDIRLHTPADRINFSAKQATAWLRRPGVLGGYIVELFQPDFRLGRGAIDEIVSSFREHLMKLGGLVALPVTPTSLSGSGRGHSVMSVDLVRDREKSLIALPLIDRVPAPAERERAARLLKRRDFSVERHQALLGQLAVEPLVRRVVLPPALQPLPVVSSETRQSLKFPSPPADSSPVVGIVDGGVADYSKLSAWKAGGTDLIPLADRHVGHGTFIAGLVAAGRTLNPHFEPKLERTGCRYYDIPMVPRQSLMTDYYDTLYDFLDQLNVEVGRAKSDTGVRVFNLSLGSPSLRQGLGYSVFAQALDEITMEQDVLFVVSAGNLPGTEARIPWPADGNSAVRMLAGGSATDERITAPAENLLGLTVGAVNPPGIAGHSPDLPTTYTRRGPGVGGARKPDLCHYGGVSRRGSNTTGLFSLDARERLVDNNGTSFSAPLVAATAATLDHRLEGMVSRETLIALMVHRAERSKAMQHPALSHIARDFVGFGMAPTADMCLTDKMHTVTLVFSEVLRVGHKLDFVFSWPRSLVTDKGKCRGQVDLTLAYSPPIDGQFDTESLRVQLEASLQQIEVDKSTGEEDPKTRLSHYDNSLPKELDYTEKYLLKHGLKWTPVKRYVLSMPRGRGTSSNWRLVLRSSARAGALYPQDGVPFTITMTITDPQGEAAIYDEVRNQIRGLGLALADITVAHRVRPRT